MSSPTSGRFFIFETLRPNRIAGDENRDVVDQREAGLKRAADVEARRFFASDRQIIDHDFRAGILQLRDDPLAGRFLLQRLKSALRLVAAHVRRDAVEHAAHLHDRAGLGNFGAENFGAIRRGEDRLAHVEPDFAPVDIERGHDLDVVRRIRPDLAMHQPGGVAILRSAPVEAQSLDQRTGAIAYANDRDRNFAHEKRQPCRTAPPGASLQNRQR